MSRQRTSRRLNIKQLAAFADTTAAWHLQADGQWLKSRGADGEPLNDLQEMLIALHTRRQVL